VRNKWVVSSKLTIWRLADEQPQCRETDEKRAYVTKLLLKKEHHHHHLHFNDRFSIMAALRSRCGHYIFVLCFLLSSFYFLFFLAYSQPSQIGCLPYCHTWCGLSVNLEYRSEMCCTRLAANTEHKNDAKIDHLPTHHHTTLSVISSQLRHVLTIGKKTCC